MKTKYIECCCNSFNHLTRLCYDTKSNTFYFEYKLIPYPGHQFYVTIKNPFSLIKYKIKWFKNYIIGICRAICGLPNWYVAEPEYDTDDAYKIYLFLKENLKINEGEKC